MLLNVSADADPYTGLAVHDTSPECEYKYEEAKVKHVLYWCTIGGTSVASPLIASTFALAGGASKVEYPAKTLYENEVKSPGSLHDVTAGSNGECTKPFTKTGLSGCTSTEESKSCASKGICLAGTGYDGPTGSGRPTGSPRSSRRRSRHTRGLFGESGIGVGERGDSDQDNWHGVCGRRDRGGWTGWWRRTDGDPGLQSGCGLSDRNHRHDRWPGQSRHLQPVRHRLGCNQPRQPR